MSKTSKGNYYKLRTKKWLELEGYIVANLESTYRIPTKDKKTGEKRILFVKRDVWGADLMARNGENVVFVQVKANRGDIATGMKEFMKGPWPLSVGRWVVHWPAGRRIDVGPDIVDVTDAVKSM